MSKANLFFSAFILSAVFLLGCSSNETCSCVDGNGSNSSSVDPSSNSNSNSSPSSISSSSKGGGVALPDQDLVKKNITLSSDKSYADIDGEPVAYTAEDAANNLNKKQFNL